MPRLSREFVKLETRILNDYRFFTMNEFEQLVYVKLLGISRSNSNQIPKNLGVLGQLLRTNRKPTEIKSALKRIKSNFPKFKENKYFWYFDDYDLRLGNSIPKPKNNSCEDEDKEEEEEEDKIKKKRHLEFVFLNDQEYQRLKDKFGEQATQNYIERLNNYIGSKGKKYKSHYHTILTWAGKDMPTKRTMGGLL